MCAVLVSDKLVFCSWTSINRTRFSVWDIKAGTICVVLFVGILDVVDGSVGVQKHSSFEA